MINSPSIFERLAKIPAFKNGFENILKEKFDAELAEDYVKYFLN
jgi:hypothetical protein